MTDSSHGQFPPPPPPPGGEMAWAGYPPPANAGRDEKLRRRFKLWGTIGTGAAFAGALTYVGLVDPHRAGSFFPQCVFKLMTGLECPACGGLRMTHDLLHGDFAAAVVDNVYLLVLLPVLAVWFGVRTVQKRSLMPTALAAFILVSAIAWTVVRNLPGFPLVPTVITG